MTLTLSLFLFFAARGVVTDPQGKPVEGASVACNSTVTSTDRTGAFQVASACEATVRKPGFAEIGRAHV